jgi:hypothetical protein
MYVVYNLKNCVIITKKLEKVYNNFNRVNIL